MHERIVKPHATLRRRRSNSMARMRWRWPPTGIFESYLFHDYDTALVYFDRALAACPNSALAWILSSGTLSYVGRGEEAVRHAERAVRLSPFDQNLYAYYTFLGLAHYTCGAYDEAVKWGRMALSERPMYTANLRILAASLVAHSQPDEARAIAARLMSLEPGFTLDEFDRTLLPFRDRARRAAVSGSSPPGRSATLEGMPRPDRQSISLGALA